MFRRLVLLVAIALAIVVAMAWPGRVEAELRIGFANPLSGAYAESGTRNRAAAEMAVHDLDLDGGVLGQKVTLIAADDACGVEEAAAAAHRLVEAGVVAVVGHWCSHSSLIAAGIYETADILMISASSTHPRLTEEGRANVFRLVGRDDHQGRLAGDFLREHWAEDTIAILHDGSTYGEGLAAETRRRLREHGIVEALYEEYEPGASDYSALVDRLDKARTDVVYVGGYGPDAGLILRTARERDSHLQLVGGDGIGIEEFWTVAEHAGEGAIFSGRVDISRRPEAADVLARLGVPASSGRIGGLGTYAAVQVWAQAVERAGTPKLAEVTETLRRGSFDTVLGRVAFDARGDLRGAAWQWKVWTGGTQVPLALDLPTQQAEDEGPVSAWPFTPRVRF